MGMVPTVAILLTAAWFITLATAQMSTDPHICGGYMRETRGFIDFRFNATTAPPDTAQTRKICQWIITPTVPTEQYRYNITIRNVNLNCPGDSIALNFFDENSDQVSLGTGEDNPMCLDPTSVWTHLNENTTTIVVTLFASQVVYGHGFYMEWAEAYDSRLTPGRIRNTYHSWGKPSQAPNPYFAAGFMNNEISTFSFVKANYSSGYQMVMYFEKISFCEGQDDWRNCFDNCLTVYKIEDTGVLEKVDQLRGRIVNDTAPWPSNGVFSSPNGFFLIMKIENDAQNRGGARFTMLYDTVRG